MPTKPSKASNIVVSGDADTNNFIVLQTGVDEVKDIVSETLGEDGLEPHELDKAGNPSGKSTKWTIPSLEGEEELTSNIRGVILYHKFSRVRWESEYGKGEQGSLPVCKSLDGKIGVGDPGGICKSCPFAQFGSGPNNSQACRLTKHVFILREDELLPLLVVITASSLKNAKAYFRRLLSKKLRPHEVITELKLTGPVRSKSGYEHAVADFSVAGEIDPDEAAHFKEYAMFLRPWLEKTETEYKDVSGDSELEETEEKYAESGDLDEEAPI